MLFMFSFFAILGIVGGIENEIAPMSNIIWAFIILAIDAVVIYRREVNNGNKNQHKQRRIQGT